MGNSEYILKFIGIHNILLGCGSMFFASRVNDFYNEMFFNGIGCPPHIFMNSQTQNLHSVIRCYTGILLFICSPLDIGGYCIFSAIASSCVIMQSIFNNMRLGPGSLFFALEDVIFAMLAFAMGSNEYEMVRDEGDTTSSLLAKNPSHQSSFVGRIHVLLTLFTGGSLILIAGLGVCEPSLATEYLSSVFPLEFLFLSSQDGDFLYASFAYIGVLYLCLYDEEVFASGLIVGNSFLLVVGIFALQQEILLPHSALALLFCTVACGGLVAYLFKQEKMLSGREQQVKKKQQ